MKSFVATSSIFIFFGCGILSLIFGLPDRYIKRDVKIQEFAGEWRITKESENELIEFRAAFPDWPAIAPWKAIQLNADGTCKVKLEIQWLPNYEYSPPAVPHEDIPNDVLKNKILACSWKITEIDGFSDSGNKSVPAIDISINYPDSGTYNYSLYIYEEKDILILWNFIGDPDDFVPQDFTKIQN